MCFCIVMLNHWQWRIQDFPDWGVPTIKVGLQPIVNFFPKTAWFTDFDEIPFHFTCRSIWSELWPHRKGHVLFSSNDRLYQSKTDTARSVLELPGSCAKEYDLSAEATQRCQVLGVFKWCLVFMCHFTPALKSQSVYVVVHLIASFLNIDTWDSVEWGVLNQLFLISVMYCQSTSSITLLSGNLRSLICSWIPDSPGFQMTWTTSWTDYNKASEYQDTLQWVWSLQSNIWSVTRDDKIYACW